MDYYSRQDVLLNSAIAVSDLQHQPAQWVTKALLKEVCLSPKPGLVDMNNSGSHRDMDFSTFVSSISAIVPWLDAFYQYGLSFPLQQQQNFLTGIRPIGIECEHAMFQATHQVNTHKGGIFAFGLLLGAIGKLQQHAQPIDYQLICEEVAKICRGIVKQELTGQQHANTVGEKLFKLHQLTGARGEAESGYRTVREISLPVYCQMRSDGYDEETSLLQALLYLLAYNQDTNLVSRGGLQGLAFVQEAAKQLIDKGGIYHPKGRQFLYELDLALIQRNLSPGGSADLIAITWFLAQYP